MKIFLTGSTGFLGGRIKHHLEKNHDVFCLTRDILKMQSFTGKFDAIVHCVGLNDRQCQDDLLKAYDVNVTGTHNLLSNVQADRIIYLSTIHVYGTPIIGMITEKTLPQPKTVYANSHYLAERMILQHGGTVMRLSNGWGAPENPDRWTAWIIVMNAMCKQAVEKRCIEVFFTENDERNFITATDVCGAVSHFISTPHCGVFNVGSSKSHRIVDMAFKISDRCKALFGYETPVRLGVREYPYQDGEAYDFYTPVRKNCDSHNLDYHIDKLKKSGFTPSENYDQEINELLLMVRDEVEDAAQKREVEESYK